MKKIFLCALAVLSMPSFAQFGIAAEGGIFSSYNYNDYNNNINVLGKRSNTPYRLSANFLAPSDSGDLSFGGEIGYLKGPQSTSNVSQSRGIDFLVLANYNFNNGFRAVAKAGLVRLKQGFYIQPITSIVSYTKPEAAIGVAYEINDNLSVIANLNHIFSGTISNSGNPVLDSSSSSVGYLGLNYSFGY